MSSIKQRSNSRVMFQKVDKARRLLEEVKEAIEIRETKSHEIWENTMIHVGHGITYCNNILECLEIVQMHNKKIEESKI